MGQGEEEEVVLRRFYTCPRAPPPQPARKSPPPLPGVPVAGVPAVFIGFTLRMSKGVDPTHCCYHPFNLIEDSHFVARRVGEGIQSSSTDYDGVCRGQASHRQQSAGNHCVASGVQWEPFDQ